MKPRLNPARWTAEDTDIWVSVLTRCGPYVYGCLIGTATAIDRRDADLMLHFKIAYGDIMGPGYLHYRVWHAACAFQGIPHPADWQV